MAHDDPPDAPELGDDDPAVPDGGWSDAWPGDEDVFLGEEASVPPGDYGSIPSTMPGHDIDDVELRELERRIESHRTPVYPLDARRSMPMQFVWRRWRQLAMMGRSDVVDDFGRDPRATARWEPLLELLYTRWFRVETSGLEHVP